MVIQYMSSNIFPKNMIFDKELNEKQFELLESQYKKFLSLEKEVMDDSQYQLFLDKNGKVFLPKGTLIHGTNINPDTLKGISKNGILACEFLGEYEDCETFYCADFHRVVNDSLLSSYDSNFIADGKTPFNKINNQIAFIINPTSKMGGLLYYDLFDSKFDNNFTVRDILNTSAIPREFLGVNRGMASAILCGIPSNCISGIVLGDNVLLKKDVVDEIKRLFPKAYLVTRKGIIIRDYSNIIRVEDYENLAFNYAATLVLEEKLNSENELLKHDYEMLKNQLVNILNSLKSNTSYYQQATIYRDIGYQIPCGLLDKLTPEERMEFSNNKKNSR